MSLQQKYPFLTFSLQEFSTDMDPDFVEILEAIDNNDPYELRDTLEALRAKNGTNTFPETLLMSPVGCWEYTQEISLTGGDVFYQLVVSIQPNLKAYISAVFPDRENLLSITKEFGCYESLAWVNESLSRDEHELGNCAQILYSTNEDYAKVMDSLWQKNHSHLWLKAFLPLMQKG